MQLTLTFLDPPPPAQQPQSRQLNGKTRVEALDILARIIAQAFEINKKSFIVRTNGRFPVDLDLLTFYG